MSTSLTVHPRTGRLCVQSPAPWEPIVGYSRAVRSGPFIAVTGTVGREEDGSYADSAGQQARRALVIILAALKSLGAGPEHVLRTRMFVTDITTWEQVAAAHREVFAAIRPATTLVEVSRLIDPQALIEIEADAFVPT